MVHYIVLDLGTGKGYWAIDMADEYPRADVVGIDIAPIQPELVCTVLRTWVSLC
jgi:tRNA G46 methylase TrmB